LFGKTDHSHPDAPMLSTRAPRPCPLLTPDPTPAQAAGGRIAADRLRSMFSLSTRFSRLRDSLYFVPLVVVAVSIAAARLTILLDHDLGTTTPRWLLSVSVDGGRTIAASVAAATITVAAIVFSITALSSQIAATQYSPRAVAGFLEDRMQKLVIGLIVGTFSFALLVLADLAGQDGASAAIGPSVSVTVVLILGIASAVAIVAYLDHSLRRMRIDAVVRRIAEATAAAIRRQERGLAATESTEELGHPEASPQRIEAERTGWVIGIDAEGLARSLPDGSLGRIEVRVGEAVLAGDLIATVWEGPGDAKAARRKVQRSVHLSRDRTLSRDPDHGIRQLVDIGLRALSPGINDPTTAGDVVQHLKLPLREILTLDPPRRVYPGPSRQRVFLPEAPSRSARVHGAFAELRLAASQQPVVLKVIVEVLADLVDELRAADHEARTGELRNQASLAVELAKAAGFPDSDLAPILTAAARLDLPAPATPAAPEPQGA
jgi:uncharacterized membrane protein